MRRMEIQGASSAEATRPNDAPSTAKRKGPCQPCRLVGAALREVAGCRFPVRRVGRRDADTSVS